MNSDKRFIYLNKLYNRTVKKCSSVHETRGAQQILRLTGLNRNALGHDEQDHVLTIENNHQPSCPSTKSAEKKKNPNAKAP